MTRRREGPNDPCLATTACVETTLPRRAWRLGVEQREAPHGHARDSLRTPDAPHAEAGPLVLHQSGRVRSLAVAAPFVPAVEAQSFVARGERDEVES